jgi:DNA invertase Pin-like site-specific DNA recombinase
LFHIVASFAQFERDNMIENTTAGLVSARARGKNGGRPRVLDAKKQQLVCDMAKDRNRSVKEICDLVQISRATFYRYTDRPGQASTTPATSTASDRQPAFV